MKSDLFLCFKLIEKMSEYKGLFDCFSDMSVCLAGWFYGPCLNKATTYKMTTGKNTSCFSVCCAPVPLTPFYTRKLINKELNIDNSDCNDCLVSCYCMPCAISFEMRIIIKLLRKDVI